MPITTVVQGTTDHSFGLPNLNHPLLHLWTDWVKITTETWVLLEDVSNNEQIYMEAGLEGQKEAWLKQWYLSIKEVVQNSIGQCRSR